MEKIVKTYPEFNNHTVLYQLKDEMSVAEDGKPGKEIDWVVTNEDGDYLMHGVFKSADFFRSVFDLPISGMQENMYEELFYLYFEVIKLECINIVEEKDAEDLIYDEDENVL
jgi:hypothetical protein